MNTIIARLSPTKSRTMMEPSGHHEDQVCLLTGCRVVAFGFRPDWNEPPSFEAEAFYPQSERPYLVRKTNDSV